MPNLTTNLGLKTWLEDDTVNFEEINSNFEIIDRVIACKESGTATSQYSGASSGTARWRHKKYVDGTVELNAKIEFSNLTCNVGSSAPYRTNAITLRLPFSFSEIYSVNFQLGSSTIGWVLDTTARNVKDLLTFQIASMTSESSSVYKEVYVSVKGVLS